MKKFKVVAYRGYGCKLNRSYYFDNYCNALKKYTALKKEQEENTNPNDYFGLQKVYIVNREKCTVTRFKAYGITSHLFE